MELRSVRCYSLVWLLCDLIDHVEAKSFYAFCDPPVEHFVQLFPESRAVPVQVRLLHRKLVEIVLLDFWHPLPRRSAKCGFHIVRRSPFYTIPPHVKIMERIRPALLRFHEPHMLVRRVVQHHVQNDPDPALAGFCDQLFHIRECTEHRIDVVIIRYVIPIIVLRRAVYRAKPYRIDPKRFQVIQTLDDTADVTDPIVVAVLKALWIHLIDNGLFPPVSPIKTHIKHLHERSAA